MTFPEVVKNFLHAFRVLSLSLFSQLDKGTGHSGKGRNDHNRTFAQPAADNIYNPGDCLLVLDGGSSEFHYYHSLYLVLSN